jgi:hypothetical protein
LDFSSFQGTIQPVLTVTYSLPGDGSDTTFATSLAAASLQSSDGHEWEATGFRHWNPHEDWQRPGVAEHNNWDLFLQA